MMKIIAALLTTLLFVFANGLKPLNSKASLSTSLDLFQKKQQTIKVFISLSIFTIIHTSFWHTSFFYSFILPLYYVLLFFFLSLSFLHSTQPSSHSKALPDVTIEKDYKVAIGFGAVAALALSQNNFIAAVPLLAITTLLAVQTGFWFSHYSISFLIQLLLCIFLLIWRCVYI